ncbi:hypothetical protein AAC387_Pa03g3195 [Persea americana]
MGWCIYGVPTSLRVPTPLKLLQVYPNTLEVAPEWSFSSVSNSAFCFFNMEVSVSSLDTSDRSRMQIWGFRSTVFVGALAFSTSHHQKSTLLEVLTSKLHSQIMENYMHRKFLL